MKLKLFLIAALLVPVACSGGSGSSGASPSPQASNLIAFPLFDASSVLSAHSFSQTVSANGKGGLNDMLGQGAGTYDGHEVVAGTLAVMPALEAWLHDLNDHPPAGYTVAASGNGVDAIRARTREMGLDFAVFQNTVDGKTHGVIVLAVDPKTLDQKAGPVLGMIGKFKLLPQSLRDPIDAQAKKETGFTVTELTQPNTPLGAAVDSLDALRTFGGNGIVLIDATKQ
ncbi:MAG TPA: hypothetical protein VK760_10465 [Candidatus Acidoferrales bacterium]|jgi:hypothetical protein|nr:hypothetical protein [Candidatus Acidoferrales bacterium]